MKDKNNTTGLKLKSSKNVTGYDIKGNGQHEPFFVQALLNPKKNELFYVMDSCTIILNENKIIALYEKILTELIKCLHAGTGAFYLYVKKDDFFELINYQGIKENDLSNWETISESVRNELQTNDSSVFYGISSGMKVDQNSIIVPIKYKDKIYAVVKLTNRQGLAKFTKFDINIANQMLQFINIAINTLKAPTKKSDDTLRLHEKRTFKLSYFYEFISNELRRARRYKKTFSLIYFKVDNFDKLTKKIKESVLKKHIDSILDKLNFTIRETDFIAEESNSKYFIVLPETDYFGSLMTMRKIDTNITDDIIINNGKKSETLSIKMSSASFPKDGTNAKSILKALSARMEVTKRSISEKHDLKKLSFWDLLSEFIGSEEDFKDDKSIGNKKSYVKDMDSDFEAEMGETRFSTFHPQTIRQIENIIFHEATINAERKGVIYVGRAALIHTFSVIKKLPDIEFSNTRVSLITKQCNKEILFPNITYIFTTDDMVSNFYFIIYLSEKYAYGLFAKKSAQGIYYGFHTSDAIFVENLIIKLQNHYMLQEQL